MKVTEQIDALRALAVSPIEYLVVPRMMASLIMLPAVCALADALGILGGYMVAVHRRDAAAAFPRLDPAESGAVGLFSGHGQDRGVRTDHRAGRLPSRA